MIDIKRRKFKSPKVVEKRRRARVNTLSLLFLGIVIVGGGLVYLSHLDKININNIKVSGNSVTSEKEIQAIASKNLAGSYLGLFPKSNSFIYPEKIIKEELLSNIKRIEDVEVGLDGFNNIFINIKERGPVAIWCQNKDEEECYFLDLTGLIYSKAPKFSGNVFLKYFGEVEAPVLGKNFLKPEDFGALTSFVNLIKSMNLEIIEVSIDENEDLRGKLEEEGEIIFNLRQDFNQLLEDVRTILSDNKLKNSLEDEDIVLDYIDLRFGNKVFYKLR